MGYNAMRSGEKKVKDLEMLLKMLPLGRKLIGIEIGSYAGESADVFASSGKFKTLHCVDPWPPDYYKEKQIVHAEAAFDKVAEKHAGIIVKQKTTGKDFLTKAIAENMKVDFIYIDGNHKYDFVKSDLILSKQLLLQVEGKQILAGHDYGFERSPGVKIAVKEILGYPDAKFCFYSWVKFL